MVINKFISSFRTMLLISVGAIFASACSKDDPKDDPVPEPTEEEVTKSDEAQTFNSKTFASTENWKVASNTGSEWIEVSPEQGTAGSANSLTVKIKANQTDVKRVGVVTIQTINSKKNVFTLKINQESQKKIDIDDENPNAPSGMKLNATGLVKKITVGWNLGNTCESGIWDGWSGDDLDIETNWGNPKTTKEMITAIKAAGFNAIRIPTRWCVHADDNLTINGRWMARMKEIVDYAISQDMYVVLNSHHDNWYDRLPVGYNEQEITKKFTNMWTQIATYFKDYDEHLIFAGANEIVKLKADGTEDWGAPTKADILLANGLMQTFVNTVRATGGNNEWRCLMVQPWAASPSNAFGNNDFAMPSDTKQNRLLLEFHCYDPYNYAIGKDKKDYQWKQHDFTEGDKSNILNIFTQLNSKFISKGIPCIMAEFGSTQDNSDKNKEAEYDNTRAEYHKFMVSEAKKYNIPAFYWDNGAFTGDGENFGLLDRNTCTFPSRANVALKGLMDGLK